MIHKNTDPSHSSNTKPISGKQDERKDRRKVKFTTPSSGSPVNKDKQVNVIQATEDGHHEESKNEESETTLPEEKSVSLDDSSKVKYFDLLSFSSEEYDSSNNSHNDE